MPRYAFEDTKTGEQFEMDMSYDELTPFLNHNPELQQVFKINIGDSVSMGITKPPVDFQKYVLNRAKAMPGANKNTIEKRWTIPKEV
jgi:hypothetical protein